MLRLLYLTLMATSVGALTGALCAHLVLWTVIGGATGLLWYRAAPTDDADRAAIDALRRACAPLTALFHRLSVELYASHHALLIGDARVAK